jgi:hypothetical protein
MHIKVNVPDQTYYDCYGNRQHDAVYPVYRYKGSGGLLNSLLRAILWSLE